MRCAKSCNVNKTTKVGLPPFFDETFIIEKRGHQEAYYHHYWVMMCREGHFLLIMSNLREC